MACFIALLSLLLLQSGFAQRGTFLCQNPVAAPSDIVFVLDQSGSITAEQFAQTKHFLVDLVNQLQIDGTQQSSRVGLVTFTMNPKVDFPMSEYIYDKHLVIERISNLKEPYIHAQTNITGAVWAAIDANFGLRQVDRIRAGNFIFLLTDGQDRATYTIPPEEIAHRAAIFGIEIYVVLIGTDIDMAFLEKFVGGKRRRLLTIDSFPQIRYIVGEVCITAVQPAPTDREKRTTRPYFIPTRLTAASRPTITTTDRPTTRRFFIPPKTIGTHVPTTSTPLATITASTTTITPIKHTCPTLPPTTASTSTPSSTTSAVALIAGFAGYPWWLFLIALAFLLASLLLCCCCFCFGLYFCYKGRAREEDPRREVLLPEERRPSLIEHHDVVFRGLVTEEQETEPEAPETVEKELVQASESPVKVHQASSIPLPSHPKQQKPELASFKPAGHRTSYRQAPGVLETKPLVDFHV